MEGSKREAYNNMICPKCKGKKEVLQSIYSGVLMPIGCDACNMTGEVDDLISKADQAAGEIMDALMEELFPPVLPHTTKYALIKNHIVHILQDVFK